MSSNSEGIEDKNERWLTKFKSPSTQNESGIPIILEPKRGHMKLKEISKLKVSKPPRPQVSEVEAKKKTSKLVDLGDFRQKKEQQDGITFKNNM